MANIKNNTAAQETKRKLIEAAGEVFAEMGFDRATIKEITERAGVSLAAVNYHFTDKHELYYQVVRQAFQAGIGALQLLADLPPDMPPEERLHTFIRALLSNLLDPKRPKWYGLLLSREKEQPTAATERLCREAMTKCCENLEALIATLVHRPIPRRQLGLVVESVIAQCVFQVQHQNVAKHMSPDLPPTSERIDELADHITNFSVAAIHGMFNNHR